MKFFIVEHYIQRDILRSLSRTERLRFSELKPSGLENNIFMYHLKQLIAMEMVQKYDASYALTPIGIRYVAQVTRTNLDLFPQPKLFSLMVISNERGEYVMHRRSAQPFIGRLTFPGGALVFGEDLRAHVNRQLYEKVGCVMPLTLRGMASIRLLQDAQIVSHTYAQIFYGQMQGRPAIAAKDQRFTPEWVKITKAEPSDFLPDVPLIIAQLNKTAGYFFLDLKRTV